MTAAMPALAWRIAVETRSLGKALGGRPVLRRLDLAVGHGDALAVIGSNGAGKTTLLRLLAGALRPDQGQVLWFHGESAARSDVRGRIGVVGHRHYLYDGLSALENLQFYARLYRVARPSRRAAELLEWAGLARAASRPVALFSRGMAQRLSLARALLADPELLLLDEPEAGLDQSGRLLVREALTRHLSAGGAAVIASHDLAFLAGAAPRAVWLSRGRHRMLSEPGPDGEAWALALSSENAS